ncbi:MAG: hypothetical protein AAFZ11_10835 [Pseudomonadota bacterium]
MSHLPADFLEDRALRDAARAVLVADIEHARTSLSGKAVAARVAGTLGDGAKDAIDVAKTHADHNRGVLAGLIAILALWFAREPLLEIFGLVTESEDPQEPTSEKGPDDELAGAENEMETQQGAPQPHSEEPLSTGESDD